MSKIMEYVSYFFNDIATIPRLAVVLSIAFAAVLAVLFISNSALGTMAKVRKVNGRANKFFKKYESIDYFNIVTFYKKCIALMPKSVRKSWKKYELSGKPIQNSQFELNLRESVAKGGAVGFGFYLYLYIAVMAVLVFAMMTSRMPQEVSSVYVCVCLIVGAVGLFMLGMQLYFMDKKASVRLDSLIRSIYSNNKVFNINLAKPAAIANKSSYPISNGLDKVDKSPSYSNLDRINKANNLTPFSQDNDCIDRLNVLVDEIVKQGGDTALLESVHKALLAVYDIKFSKPLDELRIKFIIKKLGLAYSNPTEISGDIDNKLII